MQIIKQNSPGTVVGMDGTRCFGQAMECVIEAKVSRCFNEMVAIVSAGVDLDDSTTIMQDVVP